MTNQNGQPNLNPDELFDEVLTRAFDGRPYDDLIADLPDELREEFFAMVGVVDHMSMISEPPPPRDESVRQANRTAFLAQASAMSKAHHGSVSPAAASAAGSGGFGRKVRGWLQEIQNAFSSRHLGLAPVALILALLAAATFGASAVAARSLPGGIGYGLKESVRELQIRLASADTFEELMQRQTAQIAEEVTRAADREDRNRALTSATAQLMVKEIDDFRLRVGDLLVTRQYQPNGNLEEFVPMTVDDRAGAFTVGALVELAYQILPGQTGGDGLPVVQGVSLRVLPLPDQIAVSNPLRTLDFQPAMADAQTAAPDCTAPADWRPITVRAGHSLSDLAALGGTDVAALKAVNCLKEDKIIVGDTLFAPATAALAGAAAAQVTPLTDVARASAERFLPAGTEPTAAGTAGSAESGPAGGDSDASRAVPGGAVTRVPAPATAETELRETEDETAVGAPGDGGAEPVERTDGGVQPGEAGGSDTGEAGPDVDETGETNAGDGSETGSGDDEGADQAGEESAEADDTAPFAGTDDAGAEPGAAEAESTATEPRAPESEETTDDPAATEETATEETATEETATEETVVDAAPTAETDAEPAVSASEEPTAVPPRFGLRNPKPGGAGDGVTPGQEDEDDVEDGAAVTDPEERSSTGADTGDNGTARPSENGSDAAASDDGDGEGVAPPGDGDEPVGDDPDGAESNDLTVVDGGTVESAPDNGQTDGPAAGATQATETDTSASGSGAPEGATESLPSTATSGDAPEATIMESGESSPASEDGDEAARGTPSSGADSAGAESGAASASGATDEDMPSTAPLRTPPGTTAGEPSAPPRESTGTTPAVEPSDGSGVGVSAADDQDPPGTVATPSERRAVQTGEGSTGESAASGDEGGTSAPPPTGGIGTGGDGGSSVRPPSEGSGSSASPSTGGSDGDDSRARPSGEGSGSSASPSTGGSSTGGTPVRPSTTDGGSAAAPSTGETGGEGTPSGAEESGGGIRPSTGSGASASPSSNEGSSSSSGSSQNARPSSTGTGSAAGASTVDSPAGGSDEGASGSSSRRRPSTSSSSSVAQPSSGTSSGSSVAPGTSSDLPGSTGSPSRRPRLRGAGTGGSSSGSGSSSVAPGLSLTPTPPGGLFTTPPGTGSSSGTGAGTGSSSVGGSSLNSAPADTAPAAGDATSDNGTESEP